MLAKFFLWLGYLQLLILLIGLFRPWYVVWWEDTQNRKRVIQLYGIAALVCFIAFALLSKVL